MLDGCEISELIPSGWIGSSTDHEQTRSTSVCLIAVHCMIDATCGWQQRRPARMLHIRQAGCLLPARRAQTTTVRGSLRGMTVAPESSFILLAPGFLSTVRAS